MLTAMAGSGCSAPWQLGAKDAHTVDGFMIPTQLGVIKNSSAGVAKNYLLNGLRDYKVYGDGGKTGTVAQLLLEERMLEFQCLIL
jgi:hypothetical protein